MAADGQATLEVGNFEEENSAALSVGSKPDTMGNLTSPLAEDISLGERGHSGSRLGVNAPTEVVGGVTAVGRQCPPPVQAIPPGEVDAARVLPTPKRPKSCQNTHMCCG